MLKNLFVLGALLMGIGISSPVKGANCAMSAAWTVYQAAGACTIGNIELSNFSVVSTGTSSIIPASSITLTLDNSVAGLLGMQWNMGMSATGAGNFQDLYFNFKLRGLTPGLRFNSDTLTFNGSATGGGSTGVSSIVCTSGPTSTCPLGDTYIAQVFNPPPVLGDTMFFPDSAEIWASKDFVASGVSGGTGQISRVTNTYGFIDPPIPTGDVPEPMSFVLMGAGLVGIAALRRRNG